MMIQESSFAHSFVGLYRIYYLLWQEQSSVNALIFFIKGRFRPSVRISEIPISKKAHISSAWRGYAFGMCLTAQGGIHSQCHTL